MARDPRPQVVTERPRFAQDARAGRRGRLYNHNHNNNVNNITISLKITFKITNFHLSFVDDRLEVFNRFAFFTKKALSLLAIWMPHNRLILAGIYDIIYIYM